MRVFEQQSFKDEFEDDAEFTTWVYSVLRKTMDKEFKEFVLTEFKTVPRGIIKDLCREVVVEELHNISFKSKKKLLKAILLD